MGAMVLEGLPLQRKAVNSLLGPRHQAQKTPAPGFLLALG